MKIVAIRNLLIDRFHLVEVETDDGIVGIGESGCWGFVESTAAAVDRLSGHLIGQDPRLIEHHWQYLYRWAHFRGSVIMGAISAIDIALWDILGKHHGVPVHSLIGGQVRNKARVYAHVFGRTTDELTAALRAAKSDGFTAVGHLTPFLDEDRSVPYWKTGAAKVGDAIKTVQAYRAAVGDDVDLCIEVHRRLTPAESVQFINGIRECRPLFVEDPVTPDNFDETGYVASKTDVPIASGERLTSLWEFQMLFARNAVSFARVDVCMVGGISGAMKVAALAEASHIGLVPHNPLSAVSTAACLQVAAASPNYVIQDYPGITDSAFDAKPPPDELVHDSPTHDGAGFVTIPSGPGIGVTMREDAIERWPYVERVIKTRLHVDGSVVDQ